MALDFGEISSFADLQQWYLAARILGEEFGRAAFAAQDVDLDRLIGRVQQRERKADLVAVTGALHRIEFVHAARVDPLWWVLRVRRIIVPTGVPNNDADGHAPQVPAIGKNQNSTAVQRPELPSLNL